MLKKSRFLITELFFVIRMWVGAKTLTHSLISTKDRVINPNRPHSKRQLRDNYSRYLSCGSSAPCSVGRPSTNFTQVEHPNNTISRNIVLIVMTVRILNGTLLLKPVKEYKLITIIPLNIQVYY